MQITAIKTPIITANSSSLLDLLDEYLTEFSEKNILAITSKVISLCEGSVFPLRGTDKEKLIVQESHKYLPATLSKYGHHFTITNDTLIPMAGIDVSNAGDYYALWPKDAQATCNQVVAYLRKRFAIQDAGVIITDSTCQPLRRGTTGICLAHSGFAALNDYVGEPDLFGRPMKVTQSNISGGLAAAAVVCMGEGVERTPFARISDVALVEFQAHNPTTEELAFLHIPLEEDLFAPFLDNAAWKDGKKRIGS